MFRCRWVRVTDECVEPVDEDWCNNAMAVWQLNRAQKHIDELCRINHVLQRQVGLVEPKTGIEKALREQLAEAKQTIAGMFNGDAAAVVLNLLAARVHDANAKWWTDLETGKPLKRNVGEMLMLVCSEIAEAMEGHRKGLQDDKLPHRPMVEVELADALIRIFDIAAGMKLDLGGAYVEKMAFNATRKDHTREHRLAAGGKKY